VDLYGINDTEGGLHWQAHADIEHIQQILS